jgi:hypothetical protein
VLWVLVPVCVVVAATAAGADWRLAAVLAGMAAATWRLHVIDRDARGR